MCQIVYFILCWGNSHVGATRTCSCESDTYCLGGTNAVHIYLLSIWPKCLGWFLEYLNRYYFGHFIFALSLCENKVLFFFSPSRCRCCRRRKQSFIRAETEGGDTCWRGGLADESLDRAAGGAVHSENEKRGQQPTAHPPASWSSI